MVAANAEVLRLRYKPFLAKHPAASGEEAEFTGCYSPPL
jgi:hypothetical protein